jgi:hypothetical protein
MYAPKTVSAETVDDAKEARRMELRMVADLQFREGQQWISIFLLEG